MLGAQAFYQGLERVPRLQERIDAVHRFAQTVVSNAILSRESKDKKHVGTDVANSEDNDAGAW